jgi:hypothetical protein
MQATDWGGGDASHSQTIPYTMYTEDVLLTAMFFRGYFLIMALTMLIPTNSDLFAKRVASEKGFKPSFFFQVKAYMAKWKFSSIAFICLFGVLFFSFQLMVWERPYWSKQGQLMFSNIYTSTWYVVVSMTTVGYGDTVASTVPGRMIAIIAILFGAFILSLAVSLIAIGF